MNTFLNEMKDNANYGLTENGAVKHLTTKSALLDMFALGGAYRNRSDEDCILLFKNALEEAFQSGLVENETLVLRCLFYLRDIRGGQGERRFFRVCFKWLAKEYPDLALRNLNNVAEYGRWDDLLYTTVDTPIESDALNLIKAQLTLDLASRTPSLLAKWLPSENASAAATKKMGTKVRKYLNLTHKDYRKMLSKLRSRIKIVETLMSQNRWGEIEFDKIPSRAGLIYKNAFARRDILAKRYEEFINSKNTKVNADILNPVDIAHQALYNNHSYGDVERTALDKYWENLKDYYNGREENGLCVVDVSGSMYGTPMEAAISMGAYIAERGHGPFANHFITFSAKPQLVKFEGIDIVDKFQRCMDANWGYNTNIEAVFNMLLNTALERKVRPEDIPTRLYIFSDMEFDEGLSVSKDKIQTLLESIAEKWKNAGFELPQLIFWNLDARTQNIPAINGRFAYISGFSMSAIEAVLSGKDGYDLMLEVLNSARYEAVK